MEDIFVYIKLEKRGGEIVNTASAISFIICALLETIKGTPTF